jgi:hypothetical protein
MRQGQRQPPGGDPRSKTTGPETLSGPVVVDAGDRALCAMPQNEASCGAVFSVASVAAPAPLFTTVTGW